MLYFFSSLVTHPIFYILFFLVLGLLIKAKKGKRGMFGVAIVLALLFTNESLLDYVSEKWYG